jgi:hypothetical protein
VFSKILEHINDSEAHFAGRSQGAGVVPIVPDASAPVECVVHGSSDADGETGYPPTERRLVVCLDEKVDVVRLD